MNTSNVLTSKQAVIYLTATSDTVQTSALIFFVALQICLYAYCPAFAIGVVITAIYICIFAGVLINLNAKIDIARTRE